MMLYEVCYYNFREEAADAVLRDSDDAEVSLPDVDVHLEDNLSHFDDKLKDLSDNPVDELE